MLSLASVLDPAGIPQAVLTSPPALQYLTGQLAEASPDRGMDTEAVDATAVDEALRALHRHSLIDHDRTATHHEIRVHQLVQRATRDTLATHPDTGPDQMAALANTTADALLAVWPEVERDQLGQILRANTTALHNATGAALHTPATGAHRVLLRAANSLGETGQVAAAITACRSVQRVSGRRAPRPDGPPAAPEVAWPRCRPSSRRRSKRAPHCVPRRRTGGAETAGRRTARCRRPSATACPRTAPRWPRGPVWRT
ncbi:hypothetical protein GCM10022214_07700 [Actinomadura miaoliensis]|uniref:DUF7779 domain-containing protein n=1 Tax=Actinomadura miaoliensis TaxID=430685 RepID=A0ABP7V2B5_9ACTN